MMITRRSVLSGAAATGVVAAMAGKTGFAVPVADNNLAVLLANLRDELAKSQHLPRPENLQSSLSTVTAAAWNRLLVRQLIPTVVNRPEHDPRGWSSVTIHDGSYRASPQPLLLRNRSLAYRWTFELAYDGCIACQNCRLWQHDEIRCAARQQEIITEWLLSHVDDLVIEYNHNVLTILYCAGTPLVTRIPNDGGRFLSRIARRMNPPGSWAIIGSNLIDRLGGLKPIMEGNIDGLPVYVGDHGFHGDEILIGHDGSQQTAIVWSPNVLVNPSGILIDPSTFEPLLSFRKREAFFMDADRMKNQFLVVQDKLNGSHGYHQWF